MTPTFREGGSAATRLVRAQVVSWLASLLAAALTTAGAGAWAFHRRITGLTLGSQTLTTADADTALRSALLTALPAGLLAGFAVAVLLGFRRTRRLGAALDRLGSGAERLAAGDYDHPVDTPVGCPDLEPVATAFNGMADTIAGIEERRRRMLTDLSHEMRTPVAAIDVTLEAISDGILEFDDVALATLRAQTQRLTRLAGDITEVSAAEEGRLALNLTDVAVDAIIDSAVMSAQRAYEVRAVTLETGSRLPGVVVHADPGRLGQVLDNLLRNAAQHTSAGGHVTIGAVLDADTVAITVSDDGAGIAAEHMPHVFERFYRADPGRARDALSGTGVGLAISRGIASAHGGTLRAYSAGLGRGAEFTLRLPRHHGRGSSLGCSHRPPRSPRCATPPEETATSDHS